MAPIRCHYHPHPSLSHLPGRHAYKSVSCSRNVHANVEGKSADHTPLASAPRLPNYRIEAPKGDRLSLNVTNDILINSHASIADHYSLQYGSNGPGLSGGKTAVAVGHEFGHGKPRHAINRCLGCGPLPIGRCCGVAQLDPIRPSSNVALMTLRGEGSDDYHHHIWHGR